MAKKKIEETTEEVVEQEESNDSFKENMTMLESILNDDSNSLGDLGDLEFGDSLQDKQPTPYTTDLLNDFEKLDGTLTPEQFASLVEYVKGGTRPDFMEVILTQTNDKLSEMLKVMVVLELLRLPALYDYLNALHKNMLDPTAIKDMTYAEISAEAVNIQKEIADILNLSLKVTTNLSSVNQIPTKVEKLASALLSVSDATRQRIEEIIARDMK